jgi:hypothetical protein
MSDDERALLEEFKIERARSERTNRTGRIEDSQR